MRIYAKRKRAEAAEISLLNKPIKEVKTPKPKPIKMEKILKSRPNNRISEKVIKPVKIDATKQPEVVVIKANDAGKIRVKLNEKTWVYAKPGYDINALRRKYLRV